MALCAEEEEEEEAGSVKLIRREHRSVFKTGR